MNIVRKFMDSGNKYDIISIPSGTFNLLRSKRSPKSSLECIYNASSLSIRENGQYSYDLVVRKVNDDHESNIDDDNEDFSDDSTSVLSLQSKKKKEDEWIFTFDESLQFKKVWNKVGNVTFIWNNYNGDEPDEKVQFVIAPDIPLNDVDEFLQLLYRCHYETKYNRSALKASKTDIQDIELLVNTVEQDEDSSDDEFQDANETMNLRSFKSVLHPPPQHVPKGEQLCLLSAGLYLFDPLEEKFLLQEDPVKVSLTETGKYEFWLAMEGTQLRMGTEVSPNINPTFEAVRLGFIFNYDFQGITLSYMIKFKDINKFMKFQRNWSRCLWMFLNKENWDKLNEKEKQYILDPAALLDKQLEEILTLDDNSASRTESGNSQSEEESDEDDEDEEEHSRMIVSSSSFDDSSIPSTIRSEGNRSLTVAFRNNRSYVVRGDKIGVFKTEDDDNGLEFVAAIKNISGLNGERLDPQNPMLYMEDRSMILSDNTNKNKLYKMDLERGKVIEEWSTGDKNVVQYGPTKKFDQMTAEQTLLGVSQKNIFKIDPRLSEKNKIVQDQSKEYATKYNFSSLGTTENGYIAVGSEKGDLKLYDRLGIRAKTAIPSLGQPIRYITVSADGKWLLATCESSLLLMDLTVKTGKNSGNVGFLKSFPSAENVKTYILKISPEHASYMVTSMKRSIKFTKAYFNTGVGQKEEMILTSNGPFAISWSLSKILANEQNPYTVKRYNSDIIEDNFEFGTDKKVIVALKDDVSLSKIKSFKHPSKSVLIPKENINDFYGK
ncbi:hypothetical protein KAFR_0A07820 [Kazachstania africana CBS 2517]|uniref:Vacuolar import/degradation Vid27 C-terminal domain-containing protein n=1 Tax=Kazachstania africana (strain ATCC 22294 / BCRC 22015 / CBS 2517 / CECT 1963 / NBRC 1671 / NRRL Y-8276) TaxID=1071382 RepID=H2APB6_KAZAF|nr:hypothetical protein KAFR_0A07820 [Kazachstania africana CBS 2517]CCF56216.1 hypothetical protein KAFR_0A07820 [Kazachstania africana CBS 2517]